MSLYAVALEKAQRVFAELGALESVVEAASMACVASLRAGGKLLVCGNGGSACDAQHLVGELVGRYKKDRRPLAAIALNADGSVLTCIGNDFRYEDVFARQLEALAGGNDVLIVFTTSGESPNVLAALGKAREMGVKSIALLGRGGGRARMLADHVLVIQHEETARIQEAHQFLIHALMDRIEDELGLG